MKALARITIKPMVETLPCLGGFSVSLMEVRILRFLLFVSVLLGVIDAWTCFCLLCV